jgi:hypothetical protein
MVRFCLHCHRQLEFVPALRGELFCSPEHREFYFAGQIALNYDGGSGRPEVTIDPVVLNEVASSRAQVVDRIMRRLDSRETQYPIPPVAPQVRVLDGNLPIALANAAVEQASCELDIPLCRPVLPRLQIAVEIAGQNAPQDFSELPISTTIEPTFIPPAPPRSMRPWVVSGIAAVAMLAALGLGTFPRPSRPARGLSKAEPEGVVHAATLTPPAVSAPPTVALPDSKPLAFHILPSSEAQAESAALKPELKPAQPPSLLDLIPNEAALESSRLGAMAAGLRHASIEVTTTNWVSACSDGKEVLRRFLSSGDVRQIDFFERALLRVGNAAGVRIAVEGRPVPLGPSGGLRVIELGPHGSRLVSLPPADDGRNDCAGDYSRVAVR